MIWTEISPRILIRQVQSMSIGLDLIRLYTMFLTVLVIQLKKRAEPSMLSIRKSIYRLPMIIAS